MAPLPNRSFPVEQLMRWSPFRLDALGLVTLLGADEVARAIGSLTHNSITDYLPVFGAFKVASDQIATVEPGYSLYNITDGIWVTELAPWFTRWLASHMKWNYTILDWQVDSSEPSKLAVSTTPLKVQQTAPPSAASFKAERVGAMLLGFVLNFGLIALACVQADWYGVANAVAMIMSVLVRAHMSRTYRAAIDGLAPQKSTIDALQVGDRKKMIIVTPDGRLAITRAPVMMLAVMLDSKLRRPAPKRAELWFTRAIGWLAFGVQVVAIGQASLVTQMCTVALMTAASVAVIFNYGVQRPDHISDRLHVYQCQAKCAGRQQAYLMLEPTEAEEQYMVRRGLLPDVPKDHKWWKEWNSTRPEWLDQKDGWKFGKAQWVEDRAANGSCKWDRERQFLKGDDGVQRSVVGAVKVA